MRPPLSLLLLPLCGGVSVAQEGRVTVDELIERVDPRSDNWRVEVLGQAVDARLQALQHSIEDPEERTSTRAAELVTPDFSWEWPPSGEGPPSTARGAECLLENVRALAASLGDEPHVKLKLIRVEPGATEVETLVRFEGTGGRARAVQSTGSWRCSWDTGADGAPTALRRVQVERHESVTLPRLLFEDVTASVLGELEAYEDQLQVGIGAWSERIPMQAGMNLYGHHGLAVGDVNGDGLEDLYVCDGGGLPNRLFVQRPDGTAVDRSAEAGVDWLEPSAGALLIDLDGDGDRDLVVSSWPRVLFAENDGGGTFELRATSDAVSDPFSLAAADFDLDGDLDVYVCGYVAGARLDNRNVDAAGGPFPYHDANNGGRNALLRNDGGFAFLDVTAEVGLDAGNTRFSLAAAWEDYDNDGDQDLYVANDFGRNNLHRNDGGRFRDVAAELGVEDVASGMSVAWGDYDRDGWMDLYVGNMFSSAGSRVTYGRKFEQKAGEETHLLQRMARGNTLFRNAGSERGGFEDVSLEAGVTMGRWAWSSRFVDLDADGWEDIVVANGYVTSDDPGDL